ncbi:ATP-dependent sacrificial sulfur transferase LarE, partial [Selenomonadales bacterium OttesenSCG-928-I06]|nr:ATP-dependent sacrificial sulfur transferase LarE [Selenomonadales bacterium OttesenSCG-928-I06]
KVAIAFSGGIDSTFLAAAAEKVLKKNAYLVTTYSETLSAKEKQEAQETAEALGLTHVFVKSNELNCPNFVKNDMKRCYHCKKNKLLAIKNWAYEEDIPVILEGTNKDDDREFRPGKEAIKEIKGVFSPLNTIGFTKNEIRNIAKHWQLSAWNKPSNSCLATRIADGLTITRERLKQIEEAEQYLHDLCLTSVRIRHHGDTAKVELPTEQATQFFTTGKIEFEKHLKKLGFVHIHYKIKFPDNRVL